MSHKFSYRLFSLWIALLGHLVPSSKRDRWVEEWRGEIWHALHPGKATRVAGTTMRYVFQRSLGAARDALVSRRSSNRSVKHPSTPSFDGLRSDVLFAIRGVRRQPAFAAMAIVTLAFGIGINAAMFSTIRTVLLNPLPFQDARELVMVYERRPSHGRERNVVSFPDFLDWRDQNQVFDAMAAYRGRPANLSTADRPEPIRTIAVTHDFLTVLGVSPVLGRGFLQEEEELGKDPVAILSHRVWRNRFASQPDVLGSVISINAVPHTVVGVMPTTFDFPFGVAIWTPLAVDIARWSRGSHGFSVIARLKDGVGLERARADMTVIANHLEEAYPGSNSGHYSAVYDLQAELTRGTRPALWMLFATVGIVLLIVSANVANMQFAKAVGRHREITIRSTLGATRGRILRQLLTESLFLALVAAGFGLLITLVGLRAASVWVAANAPWIEGVPLDRFVLGFTSIVALVVAVVSGLAPALTLSGADAGESLKSGSRGTTQGGSGVRGVLVTAEVALALMLLIGAGLMTRSLVRLIEVDPGFDPTHLVTANMFLPPAVFTEATTRRQFFERVEQNVAALPGVLEVGLTTILPMTGRNSGLLFSIEGRPDPEHADDLNARIRTVNDGYLDAMRIPLLRGRMFGQADTPEGTPTLIINQTMARLYWPDEDPIGQRVRFERNSGWITIIGVVEDNQHGSLTASLEPQMFTNIRQASPYSVWMAVRTSTEPTAVVAAIERAVRTADPDIPLSEIATMEQLVAQSTGRPRMLATLVGVFAAVAVALAGIGLYGVLSFLVGQRVKEIGVRMALGGRPGSIVRLFVKQGAMFVVPGLAVGLVGAFSARSAVAGLLFGIEPLDPASYVSALTALLAIATLAIVIPVRRAARIDPMKTLRIE